MARIIRELSRFSKSEIDRFFATARRIVSHPGLTILVAPRQKDFARILIIASRKVGNAPFRNKIRRQMKAVFYENKLYNQEFDCALIARKEIAHLTFSQRTAFLLQAYGMQAESSEKS
jgi:ribonuclease P protein component